MGNLSGGPIRGNSSPRVTQDGRRLLEPYKSSSVQDTSSCFTLAEGGYVCMGEWEWRGGGGRVPGSSYRKGMASPDSPSKLPSSFPVNLTEEGLSPALHTGPRPDPHYTRTHIHIQTDSPSMLHSHTLISAETGQRTQSPEKPRSQEMCLC